MEKKILKFYVSPATEVVEMQLAEHLLVVSVEGAHFPEIPDEDENEG